nr:polysaccharide biosynthesis protein [Sphingobium yanoikuyae]
MRHFVRGINVNWTLKGIDAVVSALIARRGQPEIPLPSTAYERLQSSKVLVTGAAGSIGTAIVNHLLLSGVPERIAALDQDDTRLNMLARGNRSRVPVDLILCNVREVSAIERQMATFRPDFVIHCAALKHVDLAETHPDEAYKTNVLGTLHVLQASTQWCDTFVNLSTDKAATADNVLGRSKRLAEQICAQADKIGEARIRSFRLGNVMASRGSVLDVFMDCVKDGHDLPITDMSMRRYYMTISEVLAGIARLVDKESPSSTCLVPDLGAHVPLRDVVESFRSEYPNVRVNVANETRAGESMIEQMIGRDEEADIDPILSPWMMMRSKPCAFDDISLERVAPPPAY